MTPSKTTNSFINNELKDVFTSYKKQPLPIDKTWISPYILFLTDQLIHYESKGKSPVRYEGGA